MKTLAFLLILFASAAITIAQATRPATQPSPSNDSLRAVPADQMLEQMLKLTTNPSRPLRPGSDKPVVDKSSGKGAVAPSAPPVNVIREGTYIIDRTGRLTHTDNGQAEFVFESDGKAMRDPPLLILPNLKLAMMEDQLTVNNRDLKFRVTGMVTEYRGRNYVLLEKVSIIYDVVQQF